MERSGVESMLKDVLRLTAEHVGSFMVSGRYERDDDDDDDDDDSADSHSGMFVKDIEQSVPSLVSDQEGDNSPEATPSAQEEMSIVWGGQMQTPTPEKTAGGEQMGGAEASKRPLRRMRTPFEQYVASCKSQGYHPEALNRKGARTRGGGTNVSRGR